MIVYVRKNDLGEIVGVFANQQPDAKDEIGNVIASGVPTEPVEDDNPAVVEYLAGMP